MTARVRCVVFDFDGTLVDSNAIKRDTYLAVLADVEGAAEVVAAVLRDAPGADRHGVLAAVHARLAARGAAGLPDVAALVDAYSRRCESQVIACPAVPGALEALDGLAATLPLYVASATPEDALARVVAGRGWQDRFAGVYGGPRTKVENLRRVAGRETLAPDEILYVGDGEVDRRAAADFGCAFAGVGAPLGERAAGALACLAPLVDALARADRLSAG